MNQAFAEMKKEGVIDTELELGGRQVAAFSTHSWRRFADRVARETMAETGATPLMIDLMFGWKEEFHHKDMQIHYAGLMERLLRAIITCKV